MKNTQYQLSLPQYCLNLTLLTHASKREHTLPYNHSPLGRLFGLVQEGLGYEPSLGICELHHTHPQITFLPRVVSRDRCCHMLDKFVFGIFSTQASSDTMCTSAIRCPVRPHSCSLKVAVLNLAITSKFTKSW